MRYDPTPTSRFANNAEHSEADAPDLPRGSRASRAQTSRAAGRPATFGVASLAVVIWAASGPLFGFSSTWQLVINTSTTIVTFLMVFLIQHTQNRDGEAVQVKLGELIRALEGAHNSLVDLDGLDDAELDALHQKYVALAQQARERVRSGHADGEVAQTR